MRLAPGMTLGSYEILAPLGAGGMGEVYRARDGKLRRDVALKVLPEEVARDPHRLALFEREARMAAGLNHPNIVVLHSIEEENGTRREPFPPSTYLGDPYIHDILAALLFGGGWRAVGLLPRRDIIAVYNRSRVEGAPERW